jgi:hypothetical protein
VAVDAFVVPLAGIDRHDLGASLAANGAGQDRFENGVRHFYVALSV